MKKMHLTRRDFLKTATMGGIGLAGGMGLGPRIARSAEKGPITILNLQPFSGAYADTGLDVSRGVRFAIEDFGGKVLGREIKLIERDATNPSDSVRRSKEVVEKEGCKFIQVGTSSSVALAVAEYGAKNEVIVGCHAGADKITGEACNKFTFRWAVPTYGAVREVVPRLIKELKVNTFYTITPEYVFGEDLLRNTKEVLKEHGKEYVVGECNREHPLQVVVVFIRCLNLVLRERPDVIISTGAAVGCITCLLGKIVGARVIWIDSITNVEHISLSGRMVRYIADLFLVQWPELAKKYSGVEYAGALV